MPTEMSDDALLRLADAATEGPWVAAGLDDPKDGGPPVWRVHAADDSYEATVCECWSGEHDNAALTAFIAAAREAIPRLVREKRALREAAETTLACLRANEDHVTIINCISVLRFGLESTNG